MRFREHRGGLQESMDTQVELEPTLAALAGHCLKLLYPYGIRRIDVQVRDYFMKEDKRIGWPRTYIVNVEGYGVIGFVDTDLTNGEERHIDGTV